MNLFDFPALVLTALLFGIFVLEFGSALHRWRHHDHLLPGHPRAPR